ncbi:MAG TPA: tyrosine-type recombinase/integrase [Candidatus Eisenbergiella merdipullorum]|uniref:Tyrosine-type recombinase/integrase n=1 Tax=Candidatus Eisenbergiella merdipullorum TaxID=2838553 RepID=A0A9D2I5L6_9FIRM|nr:tyrosine-type recombinase/integrase [Candidatus Eisenbergiella merdipullorum]
MEHFMEETQLERFQKKLEEEEKSRRTIEKYSRDLRAFLRYLGKPGIVDKTIVIRYKEKLLEHYAVSSVNSMLAAMNRFFKEQGWYDCVVKLVRMQREAFRRQEKELSREEYFRLVDAAEKKGKKRLSCLMQTLCSTGIRISELPFITVEAARRGSAVVRLKGKTRTVLLPTALCTGLLDYAMQNGICTGSIFVTRNGRPMDRSNILHEMKSLSRDAGVEKGRIFPHNLRHLFACTYYEMEKDISHLADLLGHSSINTTRIYTTWSGRKQAEKLEKLELLWMDEKKTA